MNGRVVLDGHSTNASEMQHNGMEGIKKKKTRLLAAGTNHFPVTRPVATPCDLYERIFTVAIP